MRLPIKIHLENPFLGSSCYVGSESSPIIWNLTSGKTAPPPPNTSIQGAGGEGEFLEGGRIIQLNNNKLVDNAWAAPGVNGCGGFLVELLLNPIINSASGLPAHRRAQHRDPQKHGQPVLDGRGEEKRRRKPLGTR